MLKAIFTRHNLTVALVVGAVNGLINLGGGLLHAGFSFGIGFGGSLAIYGILYAIDRARR